MKMAQKQTARGLAEEVRVRADWLEQERADLELHPHRRNAADRRRWLRDQPDPESLRAMAAKLASLPDEELEQRTGWLDVSVEVNVNLDIEGIGVIELSAPLYLHGSVWDMESELPVDGELTLHRVHRVAV